jgi:hypothetical protein
MAARIDDPLGKAEEQFLDRPAGAVGLLLAEAGKFSRLAGMVSAVEAHFSGQGAQERIGILLKALLDAVRDNEDAIRRLESAASLEALTTGVTEAIFASDPARIRSFGRILGRSVLQDADMREVAAFIRDLARLTDADIKALQVLDMAQGDLVAREPVPSGPDVYIDRNARILAAVDAERISRDDFYSRCSRLHGFGLAIEVPRNIYKMAPEDHCFRMTKRAARLIELIRD